MKWLFGRPRPDPDQLARLEAVERRLKVIEADWDEWYDKFRRLYARLSKRVERQDTEDAPGAPNGAGASRPINPLAARLLRSPVLREDG